MMQTHVTDGQTPPTLLKFIGRQQQIPRPGQQISFGDFKDHAQVFSGGRQQRHLRGAAWTPRALPSTLTNRVV